MPPHDPVGPGDIVSGFIASGSIGHFHIAANAISSGQIVMGGTPDGTKFFRDDYTWAAAGGAGTPPDIQLFANSGTTTWTKPASAKLVYIKVIAGGGGGRGGSYLGSGQAAFGGAAFGGGGGGVSESFIPAVQLGATEYVTVGGGGMGGSGQYLGAVGPVGGATGHPGMFSSFASGLVFASGGRNDGNPPPVALAQFNGGIASTTSGLPGFSNGGAGAGAARPGATATTSGGVVGDFGGGNYRHMLGPGILASGGVSGAPGAAETNGMTGYASPNSGIDGGGGGGAGWSANLFLNNMQGGNGGMGGRFGGGGGAGGLVIVPVSGTSVGSGGYGGNGGDGAVLVVTYF